MSDLPESAGNSITELFQADPLSLSRSDFESIIEHYRKHRHQFNVLTSKGGGSIAKGKMAAKAEAANERAKQLGIDLDNLEI